MNRALGNTHYLADIQLSEKEHIVWQGGAERTGVVMEVLQLLTGLVLIVLLFGSILNVDKILYKKNPDYVEPISSQEKAGQAKPEKIPSVILNIPLLYPLGAAGAFCFFGGVLLASYFKVRNYWFVVTSERVCIQSGIINIQVATIDLDKVVSIVVSHSLWDRLFNTHSIEVIHAGGKQVQPNGLSLFNPYRIQYVSNRQQLPTELLGRWLPRDNRA